MPQVGYKYRQRMADTTQSELAGGTERRPASFSSLRHRDFRLLWLGQVVSVTGSQMQLAAINWHIYVLTHSALALGLVGACRAVPIILCSLMGGVVADVVDRRRLMVVTQTIMLLCSAVLAFISFSGLQHAWPIFLLTAIASASSARISSPTATNPARSAFSNCIARIAAPRSNSAWSAKKASAAATTAGCSIATARSSKPRASRKTAR